MIRTRLWHCLLLIPSPLLVLLFMFWLLNSQTRTIVAAPAEVSPPGQASGVLFEDVTASAGISMPYTQGYPATGQAWADVDGDGWLDLYLTTGSGSNKLYENNGDGTFDLSPNSATVAVGSQESGGTVFADYDGDGWPDLYVLNQDANVLFHNDNGLGFSDATNIAGVGDDDYGVTGTWADYNGDGFLDLYVANNGTLPSNSVDVLYRNNGDGTFTDISGILDLAQREKDTFTATWFDYDNDGDMDIYTVNDRLQGNVLWRNDGPGCTEWCFTDVSVSSGADTEVFGMGVAVGDYDNDADLDLYFSSIGPQVLLQNQSSQGSPTFVDVSVQAGVQTDAVGWGTVFFDYDNDGWLDLYLATFNSYPDNGNRLFHNEGDGTFTDVSAGSGGDDVGRTMGLATADYDNDGWLDFVIGNIETDYRLYRNLAMGAGANNWLTVRLDGEGGSFNRDAIGARIYLSTSDGQTQMQEVKSGSSIGAGNDLALHFGLGAAEVTSVLVRWSDGITEALNDVPVNRIWELSYLPADMALSPTSVNSNQGVNVVISRTLNLSSTGGRDVIWRIHEDGNVSGESAPCDTTNDIPWLDISPSSGATVSGQTSQIIVAFDSSGLLPGAYSGILCVSSNDPDESLVIVDAEMIVEAPTDVNLSSFSGTSRIGILPVILVFLLVLLSAGIRSRINC